MSINYLFSNDVLKMKSNKFYRKSMNRIAQKTCFSNVECPSCGSNVAYIGWLKDYTAGYCPDCNEEWLEP